MYRQKFNEFDTCKYNLVKDNQVFVIWNWTWLVGENIESSEDEDSNVIELEGSCSALDSSEDEPDDSIQQLHTQLCLSALGVTKRAGIKNY